MSNVPMVTITATIPAAVADLLRRYAVETNSSRDNALASLIRDGLDVRALLHAWIGVRLGIDPHPMSAAARLMRAGAKGFATGERG